MIQFHYATTSTHNYAPSMEEVHKLDGAPSDELLCGKLNRSWNTPPNDFECNCRVCGIAAAYSATSIRLIIRGGISSHHGHRQSYTPSGPKTMCVSTSSADFGGNQRIIQPPLLHIPPPSPPTTQPPHHHPPHHCCNNVILSWHNSQRKHQHYQSGIYSLSISSSVRSGPLVQPSTNKFPENKSLPQPTTTTHRSITTMCHIHFASPSLLGLHPPENPHP